jgi:hypothetical protein
VFKQEMLTDPKSILEQFLNIELLDNFVLNVLEENANTLYIVLPINFDKHESEIDISIQELEKSAMGVVAIGAGSIQTVFCPPPTTKSGCTTITSCNTYGSFPCCF